MSRVVHFELPADDPERAIAFYENVFGWKFEKWEGPMEYWLVSTGPEDEPGIDGGLARRQSLETGLENTIGVDSVDEAVAAIEANGGKVLRPKSALPGVGWLAYCVDTEGTTFGLMEDDPNAWWGWVSWRLAPEVNLNPTTI
jgi:predicted enzyme related to lactoylglutathione lyase